MSTGLVAKHPDSSQAATRCTKARPALPTESPCGAAPCQVDLVAFGVRIRLETEAPVWLDALLDRVPGGWIDTETPPGELSKFPPDGVMRWLNTPPLMPPANRRRSTRYHPSYLRLDECTVVTARNPRHVVDRFEHELLTALAARSQWLLLHAGVVVHDQHAMVLPGRSFAGKSTLVRALVQAGARYFSDDIAAIDHDGRVHPVPRSLALRRTPTQTDRFEATDLGWTPSCRPRPIRRIVLTRYRPAARFTPRRLSPGHGTLALFRHALSAAAAPERTFRTLASLASRVPIVTGYRGEASATATALLCASSEP